MSPDGTTKKDIFYIPQLEADGSNWPIYHIWLVWAMDARGVTGHLIPPAAMTIATGTLSTSRKGTAGVGETITTVPTVLETLSAISWMSGITPTDPANASYHQNEAMA